MSVYVELDRTGQILRQIKRPVKFWGKLRGPVATARGLAMRDRDGSRKGERQRERRAADFPCPPQPLVPNVIPQDPARGKSVNLQEQVAFGGPASPAPLHAQPNRLPGPTKRVDALKLHMPADLAKLAASFIDEEHEQALHLLQGVEHEMAARAAPGPYDDSRWRSIAFVREMRDTLEQLTPAAWDRFWKRFPEFGDPHFTTYFGSGDEARRPMVDSKGALILFPMYVGLLQVRVNSSLEQLMRFHDVLVVLRTRYFVRPRNESDAAEASAPALEREMQPSPETRRDLALIERFKAATDQAEVRQDFDDIREIISMPAGPDRCAEASKLRFRSRWTDDKRCVMPLCGTSWMAAGLIGDPYLGLRDLLGRLDGSQVQPAESDSRGDKGFAPKRLKTGL